MDDLEFYYNLHQMFGKYIAKHFYLMTHKERETVQELIDRYNKLLIDKLNEEET